MRSREDLVRQFSAADGSNPLADFKAGTIRALKQADERQHQTQQALLERIGELERRIHELREEERLDAVDAERERGTAKGRIRGERGGGARRLRADSGRRGRSRRRPQGRGEDGRRGRGDRRVCGPARGRMVFEAKDRKLSTPKALAELDRALADRDADFAVLVVPTESEIPARLQPLREYNGDKLVVALDPDEPTGVALELGYRLARARVLMGRGGRCGGGRRGARRRRARCARWRTCAR